MSGESWLTDAEWESVQRAVPIVCVDVLAVKRTDELALRVAAVGLILRETPHQGRRWCLVGGRVLHDEALEEAITRQLRDTLGSAIEFSLSDAQRPLYVAQYLPTRRADFPQDPRKHAVALTYCVEVDGAVAPQNEALDFAWYSPDRLPPRDQFGFEQDRVVDLCLARLRLEHAFLA
ncbi:MAG TPA: DUF4916 domain-containing protein [Ktedonobacterales bacterium]|nr:DUF4916 domain-containing protein [Ktedonobacterales bacterium]